MKYNFAITGLAVCFTGAFAFPSRMFDTAHSMSEEEKRSLASITAQIEAGIEKRVSTPRSFGFSASDQYVSNSGKHAFVAPGPNDLRGPCPGLNAMANHNYIPHNGVATVSQFVQGTYDVFGMGVDLGAFLSIYGAVFDGDLTSWSIGGPPSSSLLSSVGLLGKPQGISGSHNKYECDVSPARGDLYQYGNDYKLVMSQFEEMYALPLGPNGYDLSVLTPFRATRFQQSIDNNPYFFNAPFSGIAVQPAAYTFVYRYMANKSSEYPEGYLNGDVLKSFYSVTGEPGSFVWTEGHEKIPDNWYKRAIGDEYGLVPYVADIVAAGLQHFEFVSIGGNTGTVNSFTGVDIKNLTGGIYDVTTLTQGNNAICFAFQFAQQAAPDILKGLFQNTSSALSKLNSAVTKALAPLGCPQLTSVDTSQFSQFPGAKGSF
ncbi:hypothetical protein sscle_16g107540 [Sclerotinia sclerotiorum 1980 UF-70]|uniref:Heme haloperoxidase family profile domain-containing protein n=1 Tax=Sclerotinia sclerotiorum (strain ATCC 18683 / 1980 / Ss-1) TaxID=665079 RepID=A0A1D9QM20_SCLS1|nr:hypothetical protein sscle_16g107540 [Sclerotinia sclerotiorum 1980 UF-70]